MENCRQDRHPLGSEDQTLPWFYGLSAYVQDGFDADGKVVAKMKEVAEALEKVEWKCPCDQAFAGEFRGRFRRGGLLFCIAAHYLFVLRAMYEMTRDRAWLEKYEAGLGNRKDFERRTMTAPLSAAAICAYAGLYRDECTAAIAHYDYSTICIGEFFQADVISSLLQADAKPNP